MISIVLDTTNDVFVSIFHNNEILSSVSYKRGEINLADNIIDIINSLLKNNNINILDVKYIVILNGPGYFTGIRISVVVGKILQQNLNIPCITISALECLYEQGLTYIKNNNLPNNTKIIATLDIGKIGAVIGVHEEADSIRYIETEEDKNNLLSKYTNYIVVGNKQDIFKYNNIKDIFDININVLHNIAYTEYKKDSSLKKVEALYVKDADVITKSFIK